MIVGLEIDIQKIEGKFKLSQNRTSQEQQNIINQLGQSSHYEDIELSRCMASYFANNQGTRLLESRVTHGDR